jgi:hypothetical protein
MAKKLTFKMTAGLFVFLCGIALGQSYTSRSVEWGSTVGSDMCMTDAGAGNVLSCGTCMSMDPAYGSCVWAVKVNGFGDVLWKKTFLTRDTVTMLAAKGISQDRFLLVARRQDNGLQKPFIITLNASGDTVSTKRCEMAVATWDWTWKAAVASDHRIYLTADDTVSGEFFVTLMDENGLTVWSKPAGKISVSSLTVTADSSCVLYGSTFATNPYKAVITKISASGTIVWNVTKSVVDTVNNYAQSALCLASGDILVCVEAGYYGDAGFVQISQDGKTVLIKKAVSLGTYHSGIRSFICLGNGTFIVYGSRYCYSDPDMGGWYVPWLVKLDSAFDTLYSVSPRADAERITGILQRSDKASLYGYNIATSVPIMGGMFYSTVRTSVGFSMLMAEQTAYKGVRFTYRVPAAADSSSYTYTLLSPPSGMSVSAGGTISWTPAQADVSSKARTIRCLVAPASGAADTLSFLLTVQAANPVSLPLNRKKAAELGPMNIAYNAAERVLHVTSVFPETRVEIVDIRGRTLASFTMLGNHADWQFTEAPFGLKAAGTLVVRLTGGGMSIVKRMSICR